MWVFVLLFILISPVAIPIALVVLAMDANPAVELATTADADDAARAMATLGAFREATAGDGAQQEVVVSQADLDSLLAFGTRALPYLRGAAEVSPDAVVLAWSADLTRLPGGGWINLRIAVPPSERGLELASIRLGDLDLPARLALPTIGFLLDAALGDDLGAVAIRSIDGVSIDGQRVALGVAMAGADRKALAERARDRAREVVSVADAGAVRDYWSAMDRAAAEGRLAAHGSFVPHLRFAVEMAAERAAGGDAGAEMRAALLAVAIHCGHPRLAALVGDVVPADRQGRASACMGTTLGGRGDLRQHFAVSAGLEAAADSGIAFAVGEYKELLDSNRGGSGFSFDDLAADRAGIRFANRFLRSDASDWTSLGRRLDGEDAVLPAFADLPSHLTDAEFRDRYGSVDSASYRDMVAEIDTRIDRLPVMAE